MIRKLKFERAIFLTCLIICIVVLIIGGLDAEAMQTEIEELKTQNDRQVAQLLDRQLEIEIQQILIETQDEIIQERINQVNAPTETYVGEFEITYYCPCTKCCGPNAVGITHTGTLAQEGKTVAVDPNVIPLGSTLIIDGQTYIAEDTGSAIKGNKIDIFKDSHIVALEGGRHKADVWIVEVVEK